MNCLCLNNDDMVGWDSLDSSIDTINSWGRSIHMHCMFHALTLAFCSGNLAIKIERLVFTVHVYCILYMCTVPGHQDREVSVPSGSGPHPLNDPDEVGEDKEGDGVLDPVEEPKHDEAQAVENEAGWIEDARPPNW